VWSTISRKEATRIPLSMRWDRPKLPCRRS
jgi:hypothetical protein